MKSPETPNGEAECGTCYNEADALNECPNSKRACGHHCNHIWTQDICCWCHAVINDNGDLVPYEERYEYLIPR